ncbi:uncharacterized protein MYCFIDRAFT_209429 [Pseudocercospora fijiensis CIRAD86]|uniref:Uncharacterized protein n=2 Tax=Pseudocercospora fijiensis TaxID=1873960 RepID=M2ZCC4_PSEFD|nr:uncharacterized protein MYCFIDRAFT_209427 [Pseudocercospora fijiensis CIRAD86]XP_007932689.1 uncharacterized protein MYCFIDRAFT_209429 [Pseudocercospora fijiensis CIRAD86]EME76738.1 hypothetical protein MYCFIDRAFT_209429 [Pseudocercospora fijiensis CIRAD86]EME76739.1 hypothetical protein MYCFIDRAFT_209427 [Pseudocercospora fijiensis CIRAD86]
MNKKFFINLGFTVLFTITLRAFYYHVLHITSSLLEPFSWEFISFFSILSLFKCLIYHYSEMGIKQDHIMLMENSNGLGNQGNAVNNNGLANQGNGINNNGLANQGNAVNNNGLGNIPEDIAYTDGFSSTQETA